MGHVPHLLLLPPWPDESLALGPGHRDHLRVLRRPEGSPLSYTDGEGTVGEGEYRAGRLLRGPERRVDPVAPELTVALAPPASRDRQRFAVEKLAELGVGRVVWLATRHGEGRPPATVKAQAWADAALEQSRGGWRTIVADGMLPPDDLPGPRWVATAGAPPPPPPPARLTILVGPEGGWEPDEVAGWTSFGLGDRVLRVETAAVAAAAVLTSATLRAGSPRSAAVD